MITVNVSRNRRSKQIELNRIGNVKNHVRTYKYYEYANVSRCTVCLC